MAGVRFFTVWMRFLLLSQRCKKHKTDKVSGCVYQIAYPWLTPV